MAKDYYAILGVDRTATEADIKKAFRKLAHEHHPDKGNGGDAKFKEANEAYQVLGNKEKRKQYDQFGANFDQAGAQGFSWQDFSRGANPNSGFGNFSQGQQYDFGDLGDVLGDMFGFGGQRTRGGSRAVRGNDVETTVSISFDDAYNGAEKKINLSIIATCDTCSGSGNDPSATVVTCTHCNGSGTITAVKNTFLGAIRTQASCSHCNGTGKHADKKCTACDGATVKNKRSTFSINIPAGIDEEKAIRLSGKGEAGMRGGPSGDLYVHVKIDDHPLFKRDSYNIQNRENLPLSMLISGGTAQVETPTGKAKLKIPAHTASGTKFILRNKGFERLAGRGRGDQEVTVHASVPGKLTAKQKALLEEFEKSLDSEGSKRWW